MVALPPRGFKHEVELNLVSDSTTFITLRFAATSNSDLSASSKGRVRGLLRLHYTKHSGHLEHCITHCHASFSALESIVQLLRTSFHWLGQVRKGNQEIEISLHSVRALGLTRW